MELREVKSSNVKKVGYEGGRLYVEFASGVYEYSDVPEALYESLCAAESIGRFLNANVYGRHAYRKLAAEEIATLTAAAPKGAGAEEGR